jgi:two-component system, sensor histidine kinase PdtaS
LALAASELLQNAFKHAFPTRGEGRVVVTVRAGQEQHEIEVADDGIGERAPRPERKGLGHEIVETLIQHDLKGHFEIHASAAGTRALLRFPARNHGATA